MPLACVRVCDYVIVVVVSAEFDFAGFSRDVCRSMVALMDVDMTGKLGLDEFIHLWKSVRTWKVRDRTCICAIF